MELAAVVMTPSGMASSHTSAVLSMMRHDEG